MCYDSNPVISRKHIVNIVGNHFDYDVIFIFFNLDRIAAKSAYLFTERSRNKAEKPHSNKELPFAMYQKIL